MLTHQWQVLLATLASATAVGCGNAQPPDAAVVFASPRTVALARAVGKDDSAGVRQLILAGANPNDPGKDGTQLLLWAMVHKAKHAMRALLAAGADPNQFDTSSSRAVVHYAAIYDDSTYMPILLRAHANPNLRRPNGGDSPLDEAIVFHHPAQVRMLLAAGADINQPNSVGDTPLIVAAQITDAPRILDLLHAGANPSLRNSTGHTFQTYLNLMPMNNSTAEYRQQREAINDWLRQHNIPVEPETK
jgi:uncharacterized protein